MANKRYYRLRENVFTIAFIFFTTIIIAITIVSSIFLNKFTESIEKNIEHRLIITATLAAITIVNGEELNDYRLLDDLRDSEKAERYAQIRADMQSFANTHGLMYVYFLRDVGNGRQQFILDSDPINPLGLDFTEEMDEFTRSVFENKEPVCMKLGKYLPNWYGLIDAYAPVYTSTGEFVGIVGVDISDVEIINARRNTLISTWMLLCSTIILSAIAIVLLLMFRKKARNYESASIAKSEFLSRMSHEIRTPMNAIIGFSRLAEKSGDINEARPYLSQINASSKFLLQLINSILDISKIEAGKMQLSIAPTSPAEIMENIRNMVCGQAEVKNLDFRVETEGALPNYVYCDKTYLTQVIINLLSNAIKFTPENGKVTAKMQLLESSENNCKLGFLVQDNGIGIKKASLDKIFEAFEQVDGSITRKYGGTGLGLNIAKLLVGLMGGELKVESEDGKGSTFKFSLVFDIVKNEGTSVEKNIPDDTKTVSLLDKTVLVFEDNEINQIITGTALEELGATVEYANNGKIGYEMYLAAPDKYDIVFMDIHMPEMDGYKATKLIRKSGMPNAGTIPIIAMSANVFKEDIDASFAAGMNAHIGKPFEMSIVIATLYNVLNQ